MIEMRVSQIFIQLLKCFCALSRLVCVCACVREIVCWLPSSFHRSFVLRALIERSTVSEDENGKKNNNSTAWWKVRHILIHYHHWKLSIQQNKKQTHEVYFVCVFYWTTNWMIVTTSFHWRLTFSCAYECLSLIHWSGTVKMIVRTFHVSASENIFWNNFYLIFIHFTDLKPLERSKFGRKNNWQSPFCFKAFHYWLRKRDKRNTDIEKKVQQ